MIGIHYDLRLVHHWSYFSFLHISNRHHYARLSLMASITLLAFRLLLVLSLLTSSAFTLRPCSKSSECPKNWECTNKLNGISYGFTVCYPSEVSNLLHLAVIINRLCKELSLNMLYGPHVSDGLRFLLFTSVKLAKTLT